MNSLHQILNMLPCYLLGLIMILLVYFSEYKDLLRIDKKVLISKFSLFMLALTAVRILMFLFTGRHSEGGQNIWSLISVLFVGWEDMCFVVPLVILERLFAAKSKIFKWFWRIMLVLTALSFGSGHLYEGFSAVILLSFYVPVTIGIGKRRGWGTVMIGHVLFDLITVLTVMVFNILSH